MSRAASFGGLLSIMALCACTAGSGGPGSGAQDAGVFETGGRLIASITSPTDLAVDTQYAFVTTLPSQGLPGAVLRIPLRGGQPETLATGDPGYVAVDDNAVYWNDDEDGGAIKRMSKDGGPFEVLAPASVQAMALDLNDAYWADQSGTIWGVAKDGGNAIRVGAVPVYPLSLAVDDAYVYVGFWDGSDTDAGVARVPKDGGSTQTILTGLVDPDVIAVDDAGVYVGAGRWPKGQSPTAVIARYDKATGTSATVVDLGGGSVVYGLAIAGSHLFFSNWGSGSGIEEVSATGGKPTVIAGDFAAPTTVAIALGDVYWIDLGSAPPASGDLRVLRGAAQ